MSQYYLTRSIIVLKKSNERLQRCHESERSADESIKKSRTAIDQSRQLLDTCERDMRSHLLMGNSGQKI